jgi:hypothetical protein
MPSLSFSALLLCPAVAGPAAAALGMSRASRLHPRIHADAPRTGEVPPDSAAS